MLPSDCKNCSTPLACGSKRYCIDRRRALDDVETRLGKAIEVNKHDLREKRILALQQKTALTPGEARELDFLLGIKWAPREHHL